MKHKKLCICPVCTDHDIEKCRCMRCATKKRLAAVRNGLVDLYMCEKLRRANKKTEETKFADVSYGPIPTPPSRTKRPHDVDE